MSGAKLTPPAGSAFVAALLRMQARGHTRLTANCLANEMWPDARTQNAQGQVHNLAAGVAGQMLRRYRACHEIENRVWEIVPEFLPQNTELMDINGHTPAT